MALWLIRAGRYGEHEQRFLADSACYLTWEGTEDRDLSQAIDYEGIKALLAEIYPDEKPKTRINWASQIAPFVFDIQIGDWVVMPHKHKPAIAFAEVTKGYAFDAKADPTYRHSIRVNWLNTDVPRMSFDQDLLYSFGAFMTVCRMARNDAEARVRAMAKSGWKSQGLGALTPTTSQHQKTVFRDLPPDIGEHLDVEQSARASARRTVRSFTPISAAISVIRTPVARRSTIIRKSSRLRIFAVSLR
ncbi:MAG: hypothetical protein R3E68_23395 [Burkholderiaceae bacterium]